jgi:electron transfer flavoprotein alpha subunit
MKKAMNKKIILLCETLHNAPLTAVKELQAFASACGCSPEAMLVVMAGQSIAASAHEQAGRGLDVMMVESPEFLYHNPPALARALADIALETGATFLCLPHTMQSCAAAALLAVTLNMPLVTGVEAVEKQAGRMILARSAYNGKIRESLAFEDDQTCICTLQQGAFAGDADEGGTGRVERFEARPAASEFVPLGISGADPSETSLAEADVIVAAGRGVGSEENLVLIRETARLFANAAVGASRIVCDRGWVPYARQVGVTGKTVSPRLYLACGISGAQQHLAGMKGSRFIVAINSDPHAAIFSVAHAGIVDDLTLFLPVFIDQCRKKKAASYQA